MAVGDLYQLKMFTTVFGVPCQNVFWYYHLVSSGTDDKAELLVNAFQSGFFPDMASFLSVDAEITRCECINYNDPFEQRIEVYSGLYEGAVEFESAPSQWAVGVKMGRPGAGWNYPRKRFSGFPLTTYQNNGIDSGVVSAMTAEMNDRITVLSSSNTFEWNVIRPAAGFALGNPVVTAAYPVGTVQEVYDASQMTRKG